MSTSPQHRRSCSPGSGTRPALRRTQDLFVRANPFLDAVWKAAERGTCLSSGCSDCGTLDFRRALAAVDGIAPGESLAVPPRLAPSAPGPLAAALASIDFELLRLAPRWYDALDIALFHLRDRLELGFVLEDWVRRAALPTRVLDLVLFRHARYSFPDERLADLWIDRCLDASCSTGDEDLVESLILACPERVGADPRAMRAALEAAHRSACVRAGLHRLGDCA